MIGGNAIVIRYAKALYEVSVDCGKEQEIAGQMACIENAFDQMNGCDKLLRRFSLVRTEGKRFIDFLVSELNLCPEVANCLKQLQENGRLVLMYDVCAYYEEYIAAVHGRKMFYITYAKTFTEDDRNKLRQNMMAAFGGEVDFVAVKDENLIDGLKIQYRSKILDCSVQSRMTRLRNAIKGDNYEN